MNFINLTIAIIIMSIFLSGFSQIIMPAQRHWETVFNKYKTAKTIYFVSESFKKECAKPDRNLDKWKELVSSAKELESYTISELRKNEEIWALKAIFIVSGINIEVLGVISP